MLQTQSPKNLFLNKNDTNLIIVQFFSLENKFQ